MDIRQLGLLVQQASQTLPAPRRLVPRSQGQDPRQLERFVLLPHNEELQVHDPASQLHPPRLLQRDPFVPTVRRQELS